MTPYAGSSHGPWLLKVGVCPAAGRRACTVLSINVFFFITLDSGFQVGVLFISMFLPVNFSPPTKITLLSSPLFLFLTQWRVHFMKKLGSVFLLHFNPSAQPLPSAVAFPSQLEFKYSSQFILETPTAPLCQVQGDPLQLLLSFSFFPSPFPSSSPFPFSSPFSPLLLLFSWETEVSLCLGWLTEFYLS